MNKRQWYTFAVIFFLGFLFFIIDATLQASSAAIEFLINGATTFYQAQTIRSAIYGSVGTLLAIFASAFWIAGFFEKKDDLEYLILHDKAEKIILKKAEEEKEYDKYLIPLYRHFSKQLGDNATKENIIDGFFKFEYKKFSSEPKIKSDKEYFTEYFFVWISRLLNKFDLKYNDKEVKEMIASYYKKEGKKK